MIGDAAGNLRALCREGFALTRSTDRVLVGRFMARLALGMSDAVAEMGPARAAAFVTEEADAWALEHGCAWCGSEIPCENDPDAGGKEDE